MLLDSAAVERREQCGCTGPLPRHADPQAGQHRTQEQLARFLHWEPECGGRCFASWRRSTKNARADLPLDDVAWLDDLSQTHSKSAWRAWFDPSQQLGAVCAP